MKLDRKLLLYAVETVKPALAAKDIIQELVHVWFDGKMVTAFNDTSLGIQVPLKSEFKGGVRGSVILGILSNSRAKEVSIEMVDETEALMTAARAKVKLALLPQDAAIWEIPEFKKAKPFPMPKGFVDALKSVSISIGTDASIPEHIGVTIVAKDGLNFFTMDGRTIAWRKLPKAQGWPNADGTPIILPALFVEQLIKLADDDTKLTVDQNSIMAVTGDNVKIFCRLIDAKEPMDFFRKVGTATKGLKPFPIPERLGMALERVLVVLSVSPDEALTMEGAGEFLLLTAESGIAKISDRLKLQQAVRTDPCRVSPQAVKRGLEFAEAIAFSGHSTIMTGPNFTYTIANFE